MWKLCYHKLNGAKLKLVSSQHNNWLFSSSECHKVSILHKIRIWSELKLCLQFSFKNKTKRGGLCTLLMSKKQLHYMIRNFAHDPSLNSFDLLTSLGKSDSIWSNNYKLLKFTEQIYWHVNSDFFLKVNITSNYIKNFHRKVCRCTFMTCSDNQKTYRTCKIK